MSWCRTWYLANDTQLFLMLPFMTKLHSKNRRAAWLVLVLSILACLGIRAALDLKYSLSDCLGSNSSSELLDEARDQTVLYNKPFVQTSHANQTFDRPQFRYTRALPYLIGIGLAYFYSEKGGAKNTQKLTLSKPFVALLWTLTALSLGFCVYGTYGMRKSAGADAGGCTWNNYQNFFYNVFSTLAWSFGICFIIFAGLFGYGGIVTKILANDLFCPLSRLVYCAYLVHPMLMYVLYFGGNKQPDWTDYRSTMDFFAFAFASFTVALVGHLLVEKPLNGIQKILLPAAR